MDCEFGVDVEKQLNCVARSPPLVNTRRTELSADGVADRLRMESEDVL